MPLERILLFLKRIDLPKFHLFKENVKALKEPGRFHPSARPSVNTCSKKEETNPTHT